MKPDQKKIINFILLIALLSTACVGVRRADIEIKDEKAVRLVKEGAKLYDKGKYEEALEKFSEAGSQAGLPEDKVKIADILFKGGFALSEEKIFQTAVSYYEHSLEIYRTLDNKPGLVNNYSYIGKIYTDIGKYEEGIRYFKEALKVQEELKDRSGIAHNLNNVANLYSYLGDYQESIDILDRALRISEEVKDSERTARTLINLGTINFRLRNYEKSIEYLSRAFDIADKTNKENLKATTLSLIGVVNRSQGNYTEALDSYNRALKINKKLELRSEIATSLSIIGELHKELGRYDEALRYLQESLEMSEASKDRLMTAVNLNYIGEVRYKQGRYEEAFKFYDSSLSIFQELGFKDRIARSYNNIGYVRGEMKEWDSAVENLDRAIAIYKDLGDREWIRVALFGKGVYLERKGDLISAEENYKEAVDVFETIREDVSGGEEAEQLFSEVNVRLYESLVSLLLRLSKREEALEYIERSRSKTLRDTFLRNGISSYDEGTRGLLEKFDGLFRKETSINRELVRERIKPLPNPEKIENLVKTLTKTREEFDHINSELMTRYPKVYSFLSVQPGTFLDMKQANRLPSNAVFLEYFITEKETYIFVISREHLIVKSVSVKKKDLNELVRQFRDLLKMNRYVPTNGWRDDGSGDYRTNLKPLKDVSLRLYHYLIKPVEDEIRSAETVAIIPFGPLHYLPFHALLKESVDGEPRFFIEEKNLIYLVSTSANYLDVVLENGRKKGIGSVVAFGNPDLGESELVLPYSEVEVLTIKKKFPSATIFIKKDATEDNFKDSWGGNEIIHLAAHGLVQEEPSILLAPLGSGALTLSDITGLPPAGNTSLVVLSACDSAIDHNNGNPTGAELNSIAMAFTMVGTPSVIATLWKVHDRTTSELMESFYENLKEEGKFDYKALRKAQISMLRRTDKYGQPFYWAPFILLGVWE
ncbi:MAG TPA: CHAT domain-containing tetratricopeptide repeat protein [Thermodesulfobacteriota bacterium]|nr:CHAT domain-containing tetratricopeptide repeat protein [Thermodesulfobacteriota bacterium]